MIVKNKKTGATYPIKKTDWDNYPPALKTAFTIIEDSEEKDQTLTPLPLKANSKDETKKQSKKQVEPSTGQRKKAGEKKDEVKK